jgi:hypothetical protein
MADVALAQDELVRGRTEPVEPRPAPTVVDRIVRWGVGLAVAGAAVQCTAHLLFHALGSDNGVLNSDAEDNVWAWASSAATFAAAFAALLLAAAEPARARGRLLLAGLLALFSLDDAVQLHEDYGEEFTQDVLGLSEVASHAVWPALFFPALALAVVLLAREARRAGGRLILVGIGLLAAGVGLEATAYLLESETWPGALEIALEESAELAGWILIATGLAAALMAPRADG